MNDLSPTPDWPQSLREGEELAKEIVRRGDPIDNRAIMWALLCDAAKTSKIAYRGAPFQGWPTKSSLPDSPSEFSVWQQIAAYLRGELEEMPTDESKPPQPSARQVTRAEAVLKVWHGSALKDHGTWARMRKAVYLRACGVPRRKVAKVTGLKPRQINHAQNKAMDDMLRAIGA